MVFLNGFNRLALVALLVISSHHWCIAQDILEDEVPNCVGLDTPNFTGDVVDAPSCGMACEINGGTQFFFDRINGVLINGTDFEAWKCACEGSDNLGVCTTIVVGEGEPRPPPTEPFDCFVTATLTTGQCGFACEVVYPFRWKDVSYTSEVTLDGSVYRKCDCNLNDPEETITFCESITAATASPTVSPTVSMAPSASMMPTAGLVIKFPTVAPGGEGSLSLTEPPSAASTTAATAAVVAVCMTFAVGLM